MALTTTEPPPTESATVKENLRTFNLVMYILIIVVSIPANVIMLLVLWRKFRRHQRTAKSFIILMHNMALSDLVLVVASIPFNLAWQASDNWPFGPVGCKILWPLQTAALQAMVYTYVALACHRLCGVTKDLFGQMKFITGLVITFVIWITSITTVIPYVVNLDYNYENKTCDESWDSDFSRRGYTLSLFLLDYLLPLIVMVTLYVFVWGKLQSYRVLDPERAIRRERHNRILRMLVDYVIVFAIFLLPHQIMWFVKDFGDGDKRLYFGDAMNVVYIFTYSMTIINPVMFFRFNPEFRRHLWHFVKCHCLAKKELFSAENMSESFSIEPNRPPPSQLKPKYELQQFELKSNEKNYASYPSIVLAETDSMQRDHDSGLGLVEASMFPSAVDRFRVAEKQRESTPTPSASPPPSETMFDYNDAPPYSFDQGSEML